MQKKGDSMEIILRGHEVKLSRDIYTLAVSMWKSQHRAGEALTHFANELDEPTYDDLRQHVYEQIIEEAKRRGLPWRHLCL